MTLMLGNQDTTQAVSKWTESPQSKVSAARDFCYLLPFVDFDSCAELPVPQ